MANFDKNFNKDIEELGYYITYYDDFLNDTEDNLLKCTNIFIGTKVLNGSISDYKKDMTLEAVFIGKTIKLPKKKLITVDYIIKKIENNNIYINFAKNFKKLLLKIGFNNINVYPTTYGIGIFIPYTRGVKNYKETINNLLESLGIEYSNEYSDAGWVYRYKISKKQSNINKINNIIN